MNLKNWLKYIAFLLLGLVLMYLAFRNQDPKSLLKNLKEVEYSWVYISMLCGFMAIISRGLRWVILIDNLNFNVKKSHSFFAVSIGYFTNLAIPRAGEITRCTTLNQLAKVPVDKLFGTIVLERVIDFSILLSTTLLVFIFKFNIFTDFLNKVFPNPINTTQIIIYIVLFLLASYLIYKLSKKILKKSTYYSKIKSFINGFKDGLKSLKGIKNKTGFWFHTTSIWVMYFLMSYVCFFAIEETKALQVIDGMYALVIGGFGMIAPVQGGIGAYHYVVKVGLETLGITEHVALLFATVVHTAQTIMTLVSGAVSVLIVFFIKRRMDEKKS